MPTGPTGSIRHFFKKKEGKEGGRREGGRKKIPPIGFIQFMAGCNPHVDFIERHLCRFTSEMRCQNWECCEEWQGPNEP